MKKLSIILTTAIATTATLATLAVSGCGFSTASSTEAPKQQPTGVRYGDKNVIEFDYNASGRQLSAAIDKYCPMGVVGGTDHGQSTSNIVLYCARDTNTR